MNPLEEQELACPACGADITLLVDCTVTLQEYVEDCPVCCQPMVVHVDCAHGDRARVGVRPEND